MEANNQREFTLNTFLILTLAVLFFDQFTKLFCLATQYTFNSSFISFFIWEDDNFFLNIINGLPKNVTKIFSGIIIFYLSLLFWGLMYFIKNKDLFFIKVGFSIFFLSFISNFFDMAYKASITNFIHLNSLNLSGNFADLFNNLSVFVILYGIYHHWPELSGKESKRKTYLISLDYQLKSSVLIGIILMIQGLTLCLFAYIYFSNYTFNFNTGSDADIFIPFILSGAVILFLFIFFSFLAVIIYTQKTVGPLVAFERYIDDLLAGKNAKLIMRKGDHLQELNRLAEKLKDGLAKHLPPPPPPPAL